MRGRFGVQADADRDEQQGQPQRRRFRPSSWPACRTGLHRSLLRTGAPAKTAGESRGLPQAAARLSSRPRRKTASHRRPFRMARPDVDRVRRASASAMAPTHALEVAIALRFSLSTESPSFAIALLCRAAAGSPRRPTVIGPAAHDLGHWPERPKTTNPLAPRTEFISLARRIQSFATDVVSHGVSGRLGHGVRQCAYRSNGDANLVARFEREAV